MYILAFLLFGLVVGLIARALIPGDQRMGLLGTILLGIGGSLVGGVLGNMMFYGHLDRPVAAGWIGSILGAILLMFIAGAVGRSRARA